MDLNPKQALGCSPAFDLGPYTGAVLLGTFISMALWGIATMQLILFFSRKHPGDSWRLKSLVTWVWAMDTVHKCLIMAGNYLDIVSGRAMSPTAPNRLMIVTQLVTSWVAVPVQVFFMYRIWRFANRVRWIFIVPLAPCILFHFVMGFVLTTVNWIRHDDPDAIPRSTMLALVVANMTVAATVDVLLAVGLCAVLWRTYLEVVSGLAGTNSGIIELIQRTVLLTINTGIWTALFAVLTMATSIRYPEKLIHIAFCLIISPVYVNTLLANLNARAFIREGTDEILEFDKSGVSSSRISSIRIRSAQMPTFTGSRISAGDKDLQIIIKGTKYSDDDDISSKQF